MYRDHKSKRLSYFRADSGHNHKLQTALKSYVDDRNSLRARKQDITAGLGGPVRTQMINHHEDDGFFFAEFLSYESGKAPQALDPEAFDQDEVPLENLLDQLDEAQRREVIDGICYVGVLGEHVVMTQALSLGARDFEGYLNAMLPKSSHLPDELRYQLVREISAESQGLLTAAKSIRIGSSLAMVDRKELEESDNKGKTRKKWRRVLLRNERAIQAVRSITGCDLDDFTADDALDLASLKVNVEISYRRYSAKRQENMIEDLTRALRDVPEDNVSIKLHNRGEIRGDKLFLWAMKSVEHINGVPVRESVKQRMREWLDELSSQGTIS